MAGRDHRPVRGLHLHSLRRVPQADRLHRRIQPRPAPRGRAKQSGGEPARVEDDVVMGEDGALSRRSRRRRGVRPRSGSGHRGRPPAWRRPRREARRRSAGCRPDRAWAASRGRSAGRARRTRFSRLRTASRERRHPAAAASAPIRPASSEIGWSISNCTSAVVAAVEPSSGPRRSIATTARPSAVSISATMAPETPMPTTRTSVRMSCRSALAGTRGAR